MTLTIARGSSAIADGPRAAKASAELVFCV